MVIALVGIMGNRPRVKLVTLDIESVGGWVKAVEQSVISCVSLSTDT